MQSAAARSLPDNTHQMLENAALLQAHYPWFAPLVGFLFGACIGSFLNVVIYRLPVMMMRDWQSQSIDILAEATGDESLASDLRERLPPATGPFNLIRPGSRCPHCDTAIKPWHNLPIIGYLVIGGKCANCKAPISARYPIIETGTALLTALTIYLYGPTWSGLAACLLVWALITVALIDQDTGYLPDDITLPFLWLGLLINFAGLLTTFSNAFAGAVLGYLVLWFVYQAFKLVTGKEGMGHGDFKMLAMLGAWLGAASIPLIIILSSFAGAVIGGAMIVFGRDRAQPLRFGPYLAVAGLVALLWGDAIIRTYLTLGFAG